MYSAHNSYEWDCEEKDFTYSVQVQKSAQISSRLFKNEPSEICSHLSEKGPKGGFFLRMIFSKTILAKEKEREKKSEEDERKRREKSEWSH